MTKKEKDEVVPDEELREAILKAIIEENQTQNINQRVEAVKKILTDEFNIVRK